MSVTARVPSRRGRLPVLAAPPAPDRPQWLEGKVFGDMIFTDLPAGFPAAGSIEIPSIDARSLTLLHAARKGENATFFVFLFSFFVPAAGGTGGPGAPGMAAGWVALAGAERRGASVPDPPAALLTDYLGGFPIFIRQVNMSRVVES